MKTHLLLITSVIVILWSPKRYSRDYIIYNIVQNVPMGIPNEIIKKNYYINMGSQQGISSGAILDVYRIISRLDPYETKKRYHYKIKVGELEIVHTENETSIAQLKNLNLSEKAPLLEIESLIIGDHVGVKIN